MTTVDTYRMLRALCDELARCGLRHACTSPGSRNTPIVLSLVREPRIRCWSHLDERCAGFFALGAAKASGTPVAITCTSGTAAANFVPAVVEAYWARVPLIVLTADRPAELRDVGAGQAIDQIKLYGDAVKWFSEVELAPTADAAAMRWIRQLACRAYWTAAEGRPGPVHLNLALREPLILDGPLEPELDAPRRAGGRPWVGRSAPAAPPAPAPRALPARGVVVAGRDESSGGGAAAAAFAARVGYPLLADPLSGARGGETAIATYDLLLREPPEAFTPEVVVRVGDLPTSKPLRAWLASLDAGIDQIAVDPQAAWQDPDAVVSEIADGWGEITVDDGDPDWLNGWLGADEAASGALAQALDGELSEPLVAARLGEWLPGDSTLFVASSMPIRDVELSFPAGRELPRVLSNRGANGIDGTVSSAFGAAAGDPHRPVTLLIGDVALAHDIGGLLAARRLGLDLTIVLLNNDGGGIFHFLPVSGEGDAFEEHVATPHGLDFERVAAVYDFTYERPGTEEELRAAVARRGGCRLIEVRTNRAENLALHRRAAAAGLAALAALNGK